MTLAAGLVPLLTQHVPQPPSIVRLSAQSSNLGSQLEPPLGDDYVQSELFKSDLKELFSKLQDVGPGAPVFILSALKRHAFDEGGYRDQAHLQKDLRVLFDWIRTPVIAIL